MTSTTKGKEKLFYGLTRTEWSDILCLIHKAQSKGHNGMMDKIINSTAIWSDLNELQHGIQAILFKEFPHQDHEKQIGEGILLELKERFKTKGVNRN